MVSLLLACCHPSFPFERGERSREILLSRNWDDDDVVAIYRLDCPRFSDGSWLTVLVRM